MTTPHERKIARALHESSEAMTGARLDLGAVHDQASGIRRRRRIGAGVGAAALVAAIAVPVTLVTQDFGNQGAPAPATSTTPSPSDPTAPSDPTSPATPESPEPPGDPDAAAAALEQMQMGDGPSIDRVVDNVWHPADAQPFALPLPATQGQVIAAAWYQGGPLLVTTDDSELGGTLRQFDGSGQLVGSATTSGAFAVNRDGTRLAWSQMGEGGEIELHSGAVDGTPGSEDVQAVHGATWVNPVGYLSDGRLVFQIAGPDGPAVMVTDFAGDPQRVPHLSGASGVDATTDRIAGTIAVETSSGIEGAVVDVATGDVVWSRPEWDLGRFSPDGKYVVGFRGPVDPAPIAMLDAATGDVVAEFDLLTDHALGYSFATGVVWEDHDSVLVSAYVWAGTDAEDHPGALLRLSADGSLERASEVDSALRIFTPRP